VKVQLGSKYYVSNLVGLGFDPMLPHYFLINYQRLMGVEVADPCGGGTGVVGSRGRGTGWPTHVADGVWWPAHVATGWGGRPTWKRVWG
jgi:hypothetical protein